MNNSYTSFQSRQPVAPVRTAAAVYAHPDDVASDRKLTTTQKRAMLASWISDARAVEGSPTLRRLDSGAVVEVEAIMRALRALDARDERNRPPPSPRKRRVIAKWLTRVRPPNNPSDDDDDPPPAPAGVAVPFRPTFVSAYRARSRMPELARALG